MNFLTKGMTIPSRKLLAVTLLFSSSFAWFFVFYTYFDEIVSPGSALSFWHSVGLLLLLVSIAVSAFLGSTIARKMNPRKLLLSWLILGILASIPILFFRGNEFLAVWGIIAGLTFGVGFPSCQAYLANSTTPDERGRVAGIAILFTFVLVILSVLAKSVLGLEATGIIVLTIVLKSIGFLSFKLDAMKNWVEKQDKPWRDVLNYRDFDLYLVAYVLFNVAAGLVSLLWNKMPNEPPYNDVYRIAQILRYVGLCVFAFITGIGVDRIGRKKPIIIGLIMLGAAYAIVGLLTTPETYFANLLLSGFAWGVIMVVYLVVPGDLAFSGSLEKFYTIGWVLPLILYAGVQAAGNFAGLPLEISVFSTILTIVLFAAILPLLYAAETLSESKIRERELKEHVERVGKIIEESEENNEKENG